MATFGSLSAAGDELFAAPAGFVAVTTGFFAARFGGAFAASVDDFPACPAVFALIVGGAGLVAAGAAGLF